MISMRRVMAIVMRHLRLFTEINRLIWTFYWPLLDMFLFGLTSIWIGKQDLGAASYAAIMMIAGVVFWQIVVRSSVEASVDLLEEIWALNMLNLFATPLRISEWILAIFILSVSLSSFVMLYCASVALVFFGSPLLFAIPYLVPFLCALSLSGLSLGFFATALVMYYGARVQWLPWMTGWLFAPLSNSLYPVTILPLWAQKIAWCLPMTWAFAGIRHYLEFKIIDMHYLIVSLFMGAAYCCAAILFLMFLFKKSKERGFARLTAD